MRIYQTFTEALNEIKRDLKEMGIRVHTKTVQNKNIENDKDYDSLELQNYVYTVTQPEGEDIPRDGEWCELEFAERISPVSINPGHAWYMRETYWKPFLASDGKFDYTYSERLNIPLKDTIEALKKDHSTRRAFVPVFDRIYDHASQFSRRIPCTLGYWLNWRQGKLNITYLQRSADLSEHLHNDIYLANRLKEYVAEEVGMERGTYTHWIGSLHVFEKDVEGVF